MKAARDRVTVSLRRLDIQDLQFGLNGQLDLSYAPVMQRVEDLQHRLAQAKRVLDLRKEADDIEKELGGNDGR